MKIHFQVISQHKYDGKLFKFELISNPKKLQLVLDFVKLMVDVRNFVEKMVRYCTWIHDGKLISNSKNLQLVLHFVKLMVDVLNFVEKMVRYCTWIHV